MVYLNHYIQYTGSYGISLKNILYFKKKNFIKYKSVDLAKTCIVIAYLYAGTPEKFNSKFTEKYLSSTLKEKIQNDMVEFLGPNLLINDMWVKLC